MLRSSETFYAVRQRDNGTLIQYFDDCTFVDRTNREDCLEYIPRILFQLLVA